MTDQAKLREWRVEGTRIMEGDLIVNGSGTFTPNENIVRRHNAALAALQAENERLREAIAPFSTCVCNDNGDITINSAALNQRHWLKLCAALEGKDG